MDHTDFTPSEPLAAALARPADDGRPLYELLVPRRPIVEDLGVVPSDASFVATRGTARSLARLAELGGLSAVWANPATPELFRACAAAPGLRALCVGHLRRLGEVPLEGAPALEHLVLDWAPRLVDLSFLARLPRLRTLCLDSMKRVDLETLPELPRLMGLHLGGGMSEALRVERLSPLTRLPNLRYLRLSNVRPADGSLRPLAELRSLRELYLPNFFEVEETARLSAALLPIRSNTLSPFFEPWEGSLPSSSPYRCVQCGDARQMMTGRPAVFLCPNCDAAKVRKRVARWEAARGSGWSGAGAHAG